MYVIIEADEYDENLYPVLFENKEAANKYAICKGFDIEDITQIEFNNEKTDESNIGAEYRFSSRLGYDDAILMWSRFHKQNPYNNGEVDDFSPTYYVTVFIPLKLEKYDDETLERVLKENEDIAFEKANKLFKEYRESHK